jgi:hypothetical protein
VELFAGFDGGEGFDGWKGFGCTVHGVGGGCEGLLQGGGLVALEVGGGEGGHGVAVDGEG